MVAALLPTVCLDAGCGDPSAAPVITGPGPKTGERRVPESRCGDQPARSHPEPTRVVSVPDGTMAGMCGRYTLTMEPESLYGAFDAEPDPDAGGAAGLYGGDPVRPRYNIAPTITVPVVRVDPRVPPAEARRQIEPMRWGLVPSWAKDISVGNRMFNARAESLTTKAAFRTALARRRCLIPASGYYEWKKLGQQVDRDRPGGPGSRCSSSRTT